MILLEGTREGRNNKHKKGLGMLQHICHKSIPCVGRLPPEIVYIGFSAAAPYRNIEKYRKMKSF